MIKSFTLLIVCCYFLQACSKDDTPSTPEQLNIVTGIYTSDNEQSVLAVYGNPNVYSEVKEKLNTESGIISNDYSGLRTYPNPCDDFISINADIEIVKTWMIKAEPSNAHKNIDFTDLLSQASFNNTKLDKAAFTTFDISGKSIMLNTTDYEEGFYRIFVEFKNGEINCSNIFVTKDFEQSFKYFESIW
ncbi:hypothetical protein [Labilibacter marinus]|uniref:hypothetical protein n=1 Tax=Labilibacter marinus TaxID=1477105 RepID=UPI0009502D85|nr:hypothetical protein [Labilibacter marinus]